MKEVLLFSAGIWGHEWCKLFNNDVLGCRCHSVIFKDDPGSLSVSETGSCCRRGSSMNCLLAGGVSSLA